MTGRYRAIAADYAVAGRLLGRELAKRYADHLADPDDDDTLLDAHITVAAIGKMETLGTAPVVERLEREADKLARKWFDEYRVVIKDLSDERRAVYADIKGMSPDPQRVEPQRPRIRAITHKTRTATRWPWPGRVRGRVWPVVSPHRSGGEIGRWHIAGT